jgi:hypothetical protein
MTKVKLLTCYHALACLTFLASFNLHSVFEAQEKRPSQIKTAPADLAGDWGGLHLAMSVTGKGASLEFDCAHGQFDKPLRRDRRSRFAVRGTYVQEHGGPVRSGEVPNSQAALYTGTIKGTQMTIIVRLLDHDQQIGTFVVKRGEPARLFRCK